MRALHAGAAMRLGGYVIHGNNRDTLGPCLDSLLAVCDEVVAVDSCSTDGSADLDREKGVRAIVHPWEGYGAARAVAVRALEGVDYVLFLDSDESFGPEALEAIRRWKASNPTLPHYHLIRRDWVVLPEGRFVFRHERHVRLVRKDACTWTPSMIVHEALPRRESALVEAPIDHRFVTVDDLATLAGKQDRYALLWAVRAHGEGQRPKAVFGRRLSHVFRNAVLKGALFRGGLTGLKVAWIVSWYHRRKHQLLREIERGGHPELVRAFREERWAELFRATR